MGPDRRTDDLLPEPSAAAGGSVASGPVPALIGLAHGSRHAEIVPALARLMDAVAQIARSAVDGDAVSGSAVMQMPAVPGVPETVAAFLDLTDPDLTAACRQLADTGTGAAVVVPLLFTQAFHATQDVPDAVAEAAGSTGLALLTAAILGTGADIRDLLLDQLAAAGVPTGQAVLLFAVGSSDPAANQAVAGLAADLQESRGGAPVAAGFGTVDPRATAVLPDLHGDPVVLPLFVSPGLLLDALARATAPRGLRILDPLGTRLAPVILARYAAARSRS